MSEVVILGVRGVPNRYGGFERFVEMLAPFLSRRGHSVTVVCEGGGDSPAEDMWNGVRRIFLPKVGKGVFATIAYDLRSFFYPSRGSVALIFGYGTALFQRVLRYRGIPAGVNMDGIEWRRDKWGWAARCWLRWNEKQAAVLSDIVIADHPEIAAFLKRTYRMEARMIPYCVNLSTKQDIDRGLSATEHGGPFHLVIARPEPENQVHIILEAYRRSKKGVRMVVVGNFDANTYGKKLKARFREVEFAGPIYSAPVLDSMRRSSRLYFHGHTVGGTNPSLIEAMAAGALVCAHDNGYNRWVLSDGGTYFSGVDDLVRCMDQGIDPDRREQFLRAAEAQCRRYFLCEDVLRSYEGVISELQTKMGGCQGQFP